jgi:hypothetical protein
MTLRELEDAVYNTNHPAAIRKIVSAYVEQERGRAADRQRRSRETQARNRQSCDSHGDAYPARVVNTHLPKEEEKEGFTLPLDWTPQDEHRQQVVQLGYEPGYLNYVVRRFRSWVTLKGKLSANWDVEFGQYLDIHLEEYAKPPKRRAKQQAQSHRHSAESKASSTTYQTPIPGDTPQNLAQIIRLMDEGKLSEDEIKQRLGAENSEIRQASKLRRSLRRQHRE